MWYRGESARRSAPRRPTFRRTASRGFTLVESAVVVAVLVVLSSVVLLRVTRSADPRNDAAAKSSLQVFQTIQLETSRSGGVPLSSSAITAAVDLDRAAVSFVAGASTDVSEVGVEVAGSLVTGVALSGSDCWLLRLDFEPTPSSPPSWWFLAEGVSTCDLAAFDTLVFPNDGSGQSPNVPTIVD
jgi:prepilin-type N-terminal cleavage/methylation domain-containing protein